jgi:hypothetical protein
VPKNAHRNMRVDIEAASSEAQVSRVACTVILGTRAATMLRLELRGEPRRI